MVKLIEVDYNDTLHKIIKGTVLCETSNEFGSAKIEGLPEDYVLGMGSKVIVLSNSQGQVSETRYVPFEGVGSWKGEKYADRGGGDTPTPTPSYNKMEYKPIIVVTQGSDDGDI